MGYSLPSDMDWNGPTFNPPFRKKTPAEMAGGMDSPGGPAVGTPPALVFGNDGSMSDPGNGLLAGMDAAPGTVSRGADGVFRGAGPAAPVAPAGAPRAAAAPSGSPDWRSLYGPSSSTSQTMGQFGVPPSGFGSQTGGGSFVGGGGAIVQSNQAPLGTQYRDQVTMPGTAAGPAPAAYTPEAMPTEFYNRLKAILERPGSVESDPAFQFIMDQGTKALGRSAGARRMRFSGKSMSDFQDFGQRAASQYWKTIADANRAAAQDEAERWASRTGAGFTRSGQQLDAWKSLLGSETSTYAPRLREAMERDIAAQSFTTSQNAATPRRLQQWQPYMNLSGGAQLFRPY